MTGSPVVDKPYWVSVIPSPRRGGMEFGATARSAGSIRGGDHATDGGHDNYDLAPTVELQ
jgi:hypothetical protein